MPALRERAAIGAAGASDPRDNRLRFSLPRTPGDVLSWARSREGRGLLRYTGVSVVSTLVSLSTIALVFGARWISSEVLATAFGNLAAAVPAYFLHRSWVWGKRGRSHLLKEVLPFWAMVVLGIIVSTVGALGVKALIDQHHWHHALATVLVTGANFVSFAVFWVLKILLFNRIFRLDTIGGIEEHLHSEDSPAGYDE